MTHTLWGQPPWGNRRVVISTGTRRECETERAERRRQDWRNLEIRPAQTQGNSPQQYDLETTHRPPVRESLTQTQTGA